MLLPIISPRRPLTLALVDTDIQASDTGAFSFSGVDFGEAAPDRLIVICVSQRRNAAVNIASATIGGVSATLLVNNASSPIESHIIYAKVPTGTSGTVAVNISSGNSAGMSIAVYRITGQVSDTPSTSGSDTTGGTATLTRTIASRTAVICGFVGGNAAITWGGTGGIVGDYSNTAWCTVGDAVHGSASRLFNVAAGSVTFTASSTANQRLALAAWQ